ncbi:MAG: hypothetical protein H0V12_00800 [Chloroflexi bacterium]|nr:hypothetical protein [Chloroflexota bacterium]
MRDRVGTNQGNNLNDIVLQPDGKVVVAGATSPDGREFDFVVGRYDAAGRPDPTFGTGGKVVTEFLGDGFATALVLQPDGRIVAAGEARAPADPTRFALARYTASGRLDGTFGSGGKVTTAWDTSASAADVALQPDGRIIAAGSATSRNADYDFAIARYTATGRLDPGFGDRGQIVTNFAGRSTDEALAVTIYPDDRVIVAGSTGPHDLDGDFALARYLAPPTGSSETHLIVRDTFGRTLANNWGRADAGGPYSLLSRASDYDVDGRTGTMLLPASRATRRAVLTQISARDVAFSFRVTTNRAPYRPGGGSGQYAYFIARRTPDGSEYRMRIRFSPTGSTYVHASRYVAGQGERSLGPEVPIDASAYAPSTYYRVEGDVLGSGPTTLRIRAYPDGQSAPVGYRGQWIDGTTGLQGAGAVGLQSYVSLTDAPVIVRFDDLYVEARSAP